MTLEAIVIVLAWFVSLIVAVLVVPRLAGKKGVQFWTAWLMSPAAEPYIDKVADRVEAKMEPRLMAFEERLGEPVQIDLVPIVGMVTESLVPRVKEEVDKVRSAVDGHLGFLKKVGNQAGEIVAEVVGEEALARTGVDPAQAVLRNRLGALLKDQEWVKAHPAGALGLEILAAYQKDETTFTRGTGFKRRQR